MAATGLAAVHGLARQIDHRVAHPHLVGCVTARNHDRIEVLDFRGARGELRAHHRLAALASVLGVGDGTDNRDGDARVAQRLQRSEEHTSELQSQR